MILTKRGRHVNEMMAVAVKKILNFLLSRFLIIRQNVNMATNVILYCGLTLKKSQTRLYNVNMLMFWSLLLV